MFPCHSQSVTNPESFVGVCEECGVNCGGGYVAESVKRTKEGLYFRAAAEVDDMCSGAVPQKRHAATCSLILMRVTRVLDA
jgi:hypothetical protein